MLSRAEMLFPVIVIILEYLSHWETFQKKNQRDNNSNHGFGLLHFTWLEDKHFVGKMLIYIPRTVHTMEQIRLYRADVSLLGLFKWKLDSHLLGILICFPALSKVDSVICMAPSNSLIL